MTSRKFYTKSKNDITDKIIPAQPTSRSLGLQVILGKASTSDDDSIYFVY